MLSQAETRKYQLFPKDKQGMASQGKGLDPEQAFALAMGQTGDKADRPYMSSLRVRMREHNLIRRRKVSVPELGPMTTVHEATVDSPTLPGRPAYHERSISAPGNDWRQQHMAYKTGREETDCNIIPAGASVTSHPSETATRQPQSPRDLPPLLIPNQNSSHSGAARQRSRSRLRSGSMASNELNLRSARSDDSPKTKTPYTPPSASQTTPLSATAWSSTLTASALPTPVSAANESRASPKQWRSELNTSVLQTPKEHTADSAQNITTPKSEVEAVPTSSASHRRNVSESSSITGSIMDRGRPRKKSDATALKGTGPRVSRSAERRAFESLPKGWKAPDAVQMLEQSEIAALQKQAAQQAARFEIMRKEDVDSLSRELRNLDERTEYLRRTYHSLRAGRRNLHARICQYLRSPRGANFNPEPMLKQEEALAELDASIDDWVSKLEQAENRRTRVRQKLLEHVAAAVALPVPGVAGVSGRLQSAMGVAPPSEPTDISTPPRSPVKISVTPGAGSSSPTPQRVIAQVPSTILEQPTVEEAATFGLGINQPEEQQEAVSEKVQEAEDPLTAGIRRAAVESIRIYAGDEVAALLVDVEQQMIRMSKAADHAIAMREKECMSDEERRELHRAHSNEVLQGGQQSSSSDAGLNTAASNATSTTAEAKEPAPDGFLLTSAVFNPKTAVSR